MDGTGTFGWANVVGISGGIPPQTGQTVRLSYASGSFDIGNGIWGRGCGMVNGTLGTPATAPTVINDPTEDRPSATAMAAYTANSKTRSGTLTWGLAAGNVTGGGNAFTIKYAGNFNWQMSLSPAIAKISTKQFNLTVTMTFANV
jgi:hypothetical protein